MFQTGTNNNELWVSWVILFLAECNNVSVAYKVFFQSKINNDYTVNNNDDTQNVSVAYKVKIIC